MIPKIWQGPLVPVAGILSVGLVLQRQQLLPDHAGPVLLAVGLGGWVWTRPQALRLFWLGLALVGLGITLVWWSTQPGSTDIRHFVGDRPIPVTLRGILVERHVYQPSPNDQQLRAIPADVTTWGVLDATAIQSPAGWETVSGRVQLRIKGRLEEPKPGSAIEVSGRLSRPAGPMNPGEEDHRQTLADRGLYVILTARSRDVGPLPLPSWGWWVITCFLFSIHEAAADVLNHHVGGGAALGQVLLLGEEEAISQDQWEVYQRTGIVHVLSVSGQHLTIIAVVIGGSLGLVGIPRRRGALLVLLALWLYSLVTGARPPVFRAVVMYSVFALTLLLLRPVLLANTLALAWIVIVLLRPGDLENAGCQLSFLGVVALTVTGEVVMLRRDLFQKLVSLPALMQWSTRFQASADDALDRLWEESLPWWQRWRRSASRWLALAYLANTLAWLLLTPLVAYRFNLISPAALVIGPPVVFLASLALVTGFFLLLLALPLHPLGLTPFLDLLGGFTSFFLWGCDLIAHLAHAVPGAWWYIPPPPAWWVGGYYLTLLALTTMPWLQSHWRWVVLGLVAWFCLGLLLHLIRPPSDELRCIFLAVGHGSCIVVETPGGRTLLYDAGAITGPQVTHRTIAPYLWQRGLHRIDEVFLSHADLDHFNGLAALLDRFAVSQVTCNPTFVERDDPGVRATLQALQKRGIPLRIVGAGQRLHAGEVILRVLHPPLGPFPGEENARSLVILVEHGPHAILLTGDLEGPGLQRLLTLPATPVDVLLAPHHGSKNPNTRELAEWARPHHVIASAGGLTRPETIRPIYEAVGATVWITRDCGAVMVRSRGEELRVEAYQRQKL